MAMTNEKVCVTGASGFLASWLVKRLLEEGYHVVGTVRDPDDASKTSHLWELPGARERLELKKADLVTQGAFDDIVQGCHGVFHVAAAVTFTYKEDPQAEIVDPCLLGTLNVLNACKRSTTVKRVVCTSSVAAVRVRNDFKPDDVLDESVWSSPDCCRETQMWYGLGKTLSEQAALEFGKESGIDVITIAPSLIAGELLSSRPTASAADILRLLQGAKQWMDHTGHVHLDDVAQAHLLAYTNPKASGRYVCSAINMSAIELASFMSKRYPKHKIASTDEIEVRWPANFKGFSSRKLQDDLGIQFKSLEQMFDDCVESLERKGLLDASKSRSLGSFPS
ncbi:tetraketide alpha-pyrone reductase 1 [Selaginella moellendorffii]|uniref:tetraketide alpha-pyrone reductase 1 n=1 Tax=Selaginella moellendorffii TaxID=88036 RepID=UPI000D1CABD8|nr:tetraketide alpha-pyrone reductase 1 [Selaginella moellendorffii]|eukprot:XP_024532701.1 tetraketide alpha-pyrone reductase 1 [Selaginella moellendorffii]